MKKYKSSLLAQYAIVTIILLAFLYISRFLPDSNLSSIATAIIYVLVAFAVINKLFRH